MASGLENIETIESPFRRFVTTIGVFPTAFTDAMTYYECLAYLVKYLEETVIPAVNENAEALEELQTLYIQLKSYVDNYFANLDVQEEINNKLDQMAEDGTLTEIIAQFLGLGALAVFDNEADMIASEHLIKGSKVKTLGKTSKNDGYGAYYTIDETGDIPLANGLYATLVPDFGGNNYISNITVEKNRYYDTDCYITTIPKNDENGNVIEPQVVHHSGKTPLQYAQSNYTTVTVNGGVTISVTPQDDLHIPIMIGDGEILSDYEDFVGSGLNSMYKYVGFKADRSYREYNVNNTRADIMLADGCINVFNIYYKLVEHGVASDISGVDSVVPSVASTPAPRQCMGVKTDGTIIFLTCDGRSGYDIGLTSAQTQEILIGLGCYDAWNMDGGGSTSTSYCGSKLNRNIDNNHTEERYIPWSLNFTSSTIDKELAKVNSRIGEEKQASLAQVYNSVVQNSTRDISGGNLNDYTKTLGFYFGNRLTNSPTGQGYLLNIPHSEPNQIGKYGKQIFFDRERNVIFSRTLKSENMDSWQPVKPLIAECYADDYTISENGVYELVPVKKPSISNTSLIIRNDDGTISFDSSLSGIPFRMTIQANFADSQSTGNRYISILKDGVQDQGAIFKFTKTANTSTGVYASFMFVVDPNVKYGFCIYGASGNKLERIRTYIETF